VWIRLALPDCHFQALHGVSLISTRVSTHNRTVMPAPARAI
jgi:hypothetical protein